MSKRRTVIMERARELAADEWVARYMLVKALTHLDIFTLSEVVDQVDELLDEPRHERTLELLRERFAPRPRGPQSTGERRAH